MQDLRFAFRSLIRRPFYSGITVAVLMLTIGANATVFSVLSGYLLRPLPYPDDDRLVMVYNSFPRMGLATGGSSIPDYLDRREQAPSLESLAIFTPAPRAVTGDGPAEQLSAVRASPSLFAVLGVPPALGRAFTEAEATVGNDQVVVVSDEIWRTRLGGQQDLSGIEIELDGALHQVVGVMPPGFGFPDTNVDAWLPFAFTPSQMTDEERGNDFSLTVGRLRDGASIEALDNELAAIVRQTAERSPEMGGMIEATGFTGRGEFLRDYVVGDLKRMLFLIQGIVIAVLLIGCANIASLQLARTIARRREFAIRASIGADMWRLARLVSLEMAVLIVAGTVAALLLARGSLGAIAWLGLDDSIRGISFALDYRVVAWSASTAIVGAVIAVIAPVLVIARANPATGTSGGRGSYLSDDRATRFRSALVVFQFAACFALLVAAGLLARYFYELVQDGPGFESGGVLTAQLSLSPRSYLDRADRAVFLEQAIDRLDALPGVEQVGYSSALPFSNQNQGATVGIDGFEGQPGASPPVAWLRSVNDGFFPSLGIPVVQGRNFAASETDRVAIVDELFAARYWPDRTVLGQRVRNMTDPPDEWYTVVGVVPVVKHSSLAEQAENGTIYWHYLQRPSLTGFVTVATELPPLVVAQSARAAIAAIDPDVPFFDAVALSARVARSLGPQRAPMILTVVFAGVAFLLAIVGIYGVLTWTVARRVGEMGVRMALGAQSSDILKLVLGQGGRLVGWGIGLGLVGALLLGRVVSAQVDGVDSTDSAVYVFAVLVLGASALLASWLPARRAARIDPMNALREE